MNRLSMRKSLRAMSVVFVASLAFAAHGSANVFDDAVFWFRGGKDKNGDGYMIPGEFFDDLQANDNSHDNHKMPMSSSRYTGDSEVFRGNAVFRNEQIVFPALGTSVVKEMQVLHISDDIQGGKYYFPFDVKPRSVFARYNISNEYTIVSRIRLDDDSYNRKICFLRLGYDGTAKKGMWLGFAKRNPVSAKYRCITVSCTPNSSGVNSAFDMDLRVPTNTWVDVAVVVGSGKLRVGIATPESLSNNPTIAFDETDMWTDNCTLLEDEKYRFFCQNGQTTFAQASGTDQTAFIGSVQQMAIWGRALSDQEVMSAFGMPRPVIFRTGFDNGDSNEFGGTRSGSSQTIDGLGSWQSIANTMQAGDTWTVNFTALRDEAGLPQIFSIKSLRGSPAQIEPILSNASHNVSLGVSRVSPDGRTFWPVPEDLITEGANTLIIKRIDSGAGTFKMDAMELGGSLGVGMETASSTDDGRVDPELISTGVSSAADPNTQHWPTKLDTSTSIKDLHFRVWVDPDVVDNASFALKALWKCDTNSVDTFTVYVNSAGKGTFKASTSWGQEQSVSLTSSVLHAGWNDVGFRSTASSPCWQFGYFRFETVLPSAFGFPTPPGMAVIIK